MSRLSNSPWHFPSVALSVHIANNHILTEAEDNCRFYNARDAGEPASSVWTRRYFTNEDIGILKRFSSSYPSQRGAEYSKWLEDESCLRLWEIAVICLSDHRGKDTGTIQSAEAIRLAEDIVREANSLAVKPAFRLLEGHPEEGNDADTAVNEKIKTLLRFAEIIPARSPAPSTPAPSTLAPSTRGYPVLVRPRARGHLGLRAFLGVNPFLVVVVFCSTMTAGILIAPAWNHLSERKGSVHEPDFFILIQTAIMTLVGVFIVIYPAWNGAATHMKVWATLLAVLTVCFVAFSIFTYLRTSSVWSILLTFAGVAFQTLMVLLLALALEA